MHAFCPQLTASPCIGQCGERYPGPASPQRLRSHSRRCFSAPKGSLRPRCCGSTHTKYEYARFSKLSCCRYTATGRPRQHHAFVRHAQKQQFSSFDDMVQNSELPVLVDFYATWCGPCQIMSQVLSKLSTQMGDKIKIVKIDTDKYPKIASRYAIQALPTLLVFQDGKQADRIEGNDAGRILMNGQLLADRLQYLLFSGSST